MVAEAWSRTNDFFWKRGEGAKGVQKPKGMPGLLKSRHEMRCRGIPRQKTSQKKSQLNEEMGF